MFSKDRDEKLMCESRNSLNNIQQNKEITDKSLLEEFRSNWSKFDRGRNLFEEYDQAVFENKIRIDVMYYNQLLQKLDSSVMEEVQSLISDIYKTINQIYEFVNIKPEIYGKNIDESVLDDSIGTANRKLSKVVHQFLENNFYSLSPEKRREKYLDSSREEAKKLISEGATPDEAISYSVKVCVMEQFLKNLSFPFSVRSRIDYLCENEDYGAVFEKDELITLVNSFETKIKNFAKIIATSV